MLSETIRSKKLGRHGAVQRAGLEISRKRNGYRVRQLAQSGWQLPNDRARRRKPGADQHQSRDPLRFRNRRPARDEASERMTQ
jgi:hypothetical protein